MHSWASDLACSLELVEVLDGPEGSAPGETNEGIESGWLATQTMPVVAMEAFEKNLVLSAVFESRRQAFAEMLRDSRSVRPLVVIIQRAEREDAFGCPNGSIFIQPRSKKTRCCLLGNVA